MADPVPWPITAVEYRGGTVLRISHVDNTIGDHDLAYLIGRGGVFADFTAATIPAAQLIGGGGVGWIIDGAVNLTALTVKLSSFPVRFLQTGFAQSYALVIVISLAALAGWYILRSA